jgi:hypothetical protein
MTERSTRGPWWLSPTGAVLLVVPTSLWLALETSDAEFRRRWRTPKALTAETAGWFMAAVLVFALAATACQVCARRREVHGSRWWPFLSEQVVDVLERATRPLFWTTMAGYAAMVLSGTVHGVSLRSLRDLVLRQEHNDGTLKSSFPAVPGVTTLTQVGIALVVVATVVSWYRPGWALRRRILIVVALAAIRAFVFAERLAIIELIVPMIALAARHAVVRGRSTARVLVGIAPLLLLPALILLFGLMEYSRSWVYYSQQPNRESFAEFTVNRFEGYYATSYNNGQLRLSYDPYPGRLPYESLEALWTAPVVESAGVYETWSGHDETERFSSILAQHGNPEFNSPSGLAIPFVDYGYAGGLVFFLVAGIAVGKLFAGFLSGRLLSVLCYPLVVTGLLELPRYMYWTSGRIVPALLALVAVGYAVRRGARRTRTATLGSAGRPTRAAPVTHAALRPAGVVRT